MREGNKINGDCKTMCGSSESWPLQSVCGQSVTEFIYLFAEMLHPLGQITCFSAAIKKGNGKLFNNLDNDDSPD